MSRNHFLVLAFPAQGHINPALQFCKRLLRLCLRVTLLTTVQATRHMTPSSLPGGLKLVDYSDGYDDGFRPGVDIDHYWSENRWRGSEALRHLLSSASDEGSPYTCLVYSILLPWAAAVARDLSVPSALLWIQPAMVFDIYYYYQHGFKDVIQKLAESGNSSASISLPGLGHLSLTKRDLPSFMIPNSPQKWALDIFAEHMNELHAEPNPRVLVNTFDALELEALTSISKFKLTAIGPLIPSAFLDCQDLSDTGFGGDMMEQANHSHVEWLDSKPDSSVIYVSFGSFQILSMPQMEEIAKGLLITGKPFLWIIRKPSKETDEEESSDQKWLSCIDKLEQLGLMITWCSQLQVLSHPAISCFLTHCGWNSTMESIVSGVPVVAFPQWSDQGTNAKLISDYWKTGLRVTPNDGDGLVEGDEIKRCLELVIGNDKMKQNAKKWKKLAAEAVKEGGSSDKNLKDFQNEFTAFCS